MQSRFWWLLHLQLHGLCKWETSCSSTNCHTLFIYYIVHQQRILSRSWQSPRSWTTGKLSSELSLPSYHHSNIFIQSSCHWPSPTSFGLLLDKILMRLPRPGSSCFFSHLSIHVLNTNDTGHQITPMVSAALIFAKKTTRLSHRNMYCFTVQPILKRGTTWLLHAWGRRIPPRTNLLPVSYWETMYSCLCNFY